MDLAHPEDANNGDDENGEIKRFNAEKCKALWGKIKAADKPVDITFVVITILAAIITFSSSRYWNWVGT